MTDAAIGANQRIVTVLFDDRDSAEAAMDELTTFGLAADKMRLVAGREDSKIEDDRQVSTGGIWDALKDMFIPDQNRDAYAEALNRGAYMLTVVADEVNYEQIVDILDDAGSVDMGQREQAGSTQS